MMNCEHTFHNNTNVLYCQDSPYGADSAKVQENGVLLHKKGISMLIQRRLAISFLALVLILTSVIVVEARQDTGSHVIVNATRLNVRTGPGAQYLSLGTLRGGEQYPVAGISPDSIWFYIVGTPYGDGWVRGRHTIFRGNIRSLPVIEGPYGPLEPATFVLNVAITVYENPGGNALGSLPGGAAEYVINGRSYDGIWVRLDTIHGDVWAYVAQGAFRGTWSNIPIVWGQPDPLVFGADEREYLIVNATRLNVRTGPDVKYASIGTLRGGEEYNILGISVDGIWFYIEGTPYGNGWVRGRYTIFRGEIGEVPVVDVMEGAALAPAYLYVHVFIPVYNRPFGVQQGLIEGRQQYLVTGRTLDGTWLRLETPTYGVVWTQATRGSFRGYYFNVPVILDY